MNESEIFSAALKLSVAERAKFLDLACKGDPAMREQVEALIKAHFDSATFLHESKDSPPFPRPNFRGEGGVRDLRGERDFDATADPGPMETPGTVIAGRYKLLEPIGEGGMGSVWLAEQAAPVKRKVAVKLIKAGMDSKSVLARFDAERQALALMDHPNIAKVYDGGMTEQGRPYFVMEYVKGIPLTEYCDQARLSLAERLKLFASVCQAVQHAHQKGIIHRDLKPTNILACLYDGQPVPKVIDFGLAKAMHQSLTDQSLHTAHGMMVGTPLYMSPEQAEHNNLDVDTRTDIYSLGVILYELLTGSTPLERQQLKEAAYNEILRLIKEVEPQKPSTRLSGSASLPSVAAQRSIEPNQLRKSLAGDLDWIVMKALDKERSRRYETANGLARDIDRYLNDEAVEACPPSATYRLRKLLRRNKRTVMATSLVMLALAAGTAAVLAVQSRANANLSAVNDKLDTANSDLRATNTLLDQQRTRAEQREQEAVDAVKRFGDAVSNNPELKNNPSLESLRNTLLQEPLAFFQSLRTQLQSDADTRPESLARLAHAAFELGCLMNKIGNKQNSLEAYSQSIDILQKLVEEHPKVTEFQSFLARIHNNIGALFNETGEPAKALAAYEKAREIHLRLNQANPTITEFQIDLSRHLNNIGKSLSQTSKPAEALAAFEQAREIHESLVQANPGSIEIQSDFSRHLNGVGSLFESSGKPVEALAAYEKALEIQERLVQAYPTVAEFQDYLTNCHNSIGGLFWGIGEPDKALAAYEKALVIQERLVQDNPTVSEFQNNLANSHNNVGVLLRNIGALDKALAAQEKALVIRQRLTQTNPTVMEFQDYLATSHYNIGSLLRATGKPVSALASYVKALEIRERLVQANPTVTEFQISLGATLNNIAILEIQSASFDAAKAHLREAIKWQKNALVANPVHPLIRQYLKNHYMNLLTSADGLADNELRLEAESGLAELVASDPAFVELDQRINDIVAGTETNSVEELLAMAQRCYDTRRFALAAKFWNQALEAEPKLAEERQTQHTYNAACAAALAGCGDGVDSPTDKTARATLRQQTLAWLNDELKRWGRELENATPEQRAIVVRTLKHWQTDMDLVGVRDAVEIAKLPEPERAEWETLWQSVEKLLAKFI